MTVKQYWFSEEGLKKIFAWARRGLTNDEIYTNMDISKPTFYSYMKDFNFFNNIKKAREDSLIEVENAMFRKAVGYYYDEVTIEDGVETKRVTKHVQGDLGAQIFILKNRLPKQWKDKILSTEDEEAINKVENMLVSIRKVANES